MQKVREQAKMCRLTATVYPLESNESSSHDSPLQLPNIRLVRESLNECGSSGEPVDYQAGHAATRRSVSGVDRSELRGRLRAQVSAGASGLGDCGNSVFEDQLLLRPGLKQEGELVKTADAAGKLGAVDQIDYYSGFFAADRVEKRILNVLRRCLTL